MLRAPKRKHSSVAAAGYPTKAMSDFYRFTKSHVFPYDSYNPYVKDANGKLIPKFVMSRDLDFPQYKTIPYNDYARLNISTKFYVEESRLATFQMTPDNIHTFQEVVLQNETFWGQFKTEHADAHWISVLSMVCKDWHKAVPRMVAAKILTKGFSKSLYHLSVRFGLSDQFILRNVPPFSVNMDRIRDADLKECLEESQRNWDGSFPYYMAIPAPLIQQERMAIACYIHYDCYTCLQFMEFKVKEEPALAKVFKDKMQFSKEAWKNRIETHSVKMREKAQAEQRHYQAILDKLVEEGMPSTKGWHWKFVNEARKKVDYPLPLADMRFFCYMEKYFAKQHGRLKREYMGAHGNMRGATDHANQHMALQLSHLDFVNTPFSQLPPP